MKKSIIDLGEIKGEAVPAYFMTAYKEVEV